MKIIKITFIFTAILIALLVLISLFMPKELRVERQTIIFVNNCTVFEQINSPSKWRNWCSWFPKDSVSKYKYNEITSGQDAQMAWNSEKDELGRGTMTVLSSTDCDSLKIQLQIAGQGISAIYFYCEPYQELIIKNNPNYQNFATKVTFGIIANASYNPVSRFMNLFIEEVIGEDIEKNLTNLKNFCEQNSI